MSFEHEIENNKKDYYRCLRSCQAQRPNENITEWITFFLNALLNVKLKLEEKLVMHKENIELEPKEKAVYLYISNHSYCKSGEITEQLDIPKPTVKRLLQTLITKKLISKFGKGAGTYYEVN